MLWPMAAVAALALASCGPALAQVREQLTLDDAFARVAQSHPDMRLLGARGDVLAASLEMASQRPALVAGVDLENAFGSGDFGGTASAELTLSLGSVLERGGNWMRVAP